ncbi:MAG: phosphotransferase family protein [Spongiibacteraceae bacterium]
MMEIRAVQARLDAIKNNILPGSESVTDIKKITAGASKNTYKFSVKVASQKKTYILRVAEDKSIEHESTINIKMEANILAVAKLANVKVPEVSYILEDHDGLGEGYIMGYVAGETIPRKILRDKKFEKTRLLLAAQYGQQLATIHTIDSGKIEDLPASNLLQTLARFRSDIDSYAPSSPVFEYAYLWLVTNQPQTTERQCFVHGDFRNGNVMVGEQGIEAVLDWELCHKGDPMEDLAWLMLNPWRFGNVDSPVGGVGREEDLFNAYEAAGGVLDIDRVRYWQIACTLRWGLTCSFARYIFNTGAEKKLEHALIARRISETEIDLLRLLRVDKS